MGVVFSYEENLFSGALKHFSLVRKFSRAPIVKNKTLITKITEFITHCEFSLHQLRAIFCFFCFD